jgi:cytochrome c peroxidase
VTHDAVSLGIHNQQGSRNAPTTYHAAGHLSQFWDGRAPNVEEQAKGPILNPREMGMTNGKQVETVLTAIPGYVDAFAKAFPDAKQPLSYDNVGKAIGAFERGLFTPSRWDDYLKGDPSALTAREKEGLRLFTNLGCMVCHTGEYVGGSMYEKLGVVEPWPNQNDKGRGSITSSDGDAMTFKVPSLRNVAMTAPYFHDGSAKTLSDAVRMMARHQLGEELEDDEAEALVAWLSALTGPLPKDYIAAPKLPEDLERRAR